MTRPTTLTPDEWLTLQFIPLWVLEVSNDNRNESYHQIMVDGRHIHSTALQMLEYAEKASKEQIVFELLYSMVTDNTAIGKKFASDSRSPKVGLREAFSILNTKLPVQQADAIREVYEEYIKKQIRDDNARRLISLADKMASPRTSTPPPPPPTSTHLPVYLLVDSSRHISDSAALLDAAINTRLCDHLRARPKRSVPLTLGFIPINDSSDLTAPLAEPATFHAPGMVGAGSCQFGRALLSLQTDLAHQLSDSKPLVIILLAGAPDDAWQKPAKQLKDLAANGKVNVIALGVGTASALAALKEVGAAQPLLLSGLAPACVDSVFDWLYGVIDVILSGLESGASGKQSVPPLPGCLKVIP